MTRLISLCCALALLASGCEPKGAAEAKAPDVVVAPAPPPEPVRADVAVAPPERVEQPPVFLWQLQVGAAMLHLLGSVHVAKPDLYPLDRRIEDAFTGSQALVLELVMDDATEAATAQRMMEAARLPPGVKLRDVIKPATWERLVAELEKRGGSVLGLRGFHPWFVAIALTTTALSQEGFSAEHGIDEHFRRRAEGSMTLHALETVEEQLSLFTSLSADVEEAMLVQTLQELDQYSSLMQTAFGHWLKGDVAALDELMLVPMRKDYPVLFSRVFSDRNRRMADKLFELSKDGRRYFVVVGAGHLIGSDGLVDLFRDRGIVATQL